MLLDVGKFGISACDVPGVLAGVLSENYNLRSVVYYPCSMPTTNYEPSLEMYAHFNVTGLAFRELAP